MKIRVSLKGTREIKEYNGDRIDILDFNMNGELYKQIRIFKNGFSKSEYIKNDIINWIKETR
ncbi:MAG: hypothetical protein ACRDCB_03155 [Clostridium sp.]|uniref:hypothetical protein n=1 Tax=Clostridium TaxID=1485 RepID=UPI0021524263|nr:hypothetical protein [Clostridium sp. LY3-2]MCR6515763.1 hypothetical protein [Clostridium sp. LY3-2]